ncbi:hypothetical protein [Agrobacterium tumefaciens]|uniref:hypothetical protein n=1 Tax=Agrobacterium tumefaciens TaxID=358 RepID=UPI001F85D764|nr:hypothetical protein [Agrobacterium tumefaciens]MCW8059194.1 hypothetical protein [Agrobacterium tumefaciens]NSX87490.1 hypothetical protein [Agrobacterium tumefaciens]
MKKLCVSGRPLTLEGAVRASSQTPSVSGGFSLGGLGMGTALSSRSLRVPIKPCANFLITFDSISHDSEVSRPKNGRKEFERVNCVIVDLIKLNRGLCAVSVTAGR